MCAFHHVRGAAVDRLVWQVRSAGRHVVEWDARGFPSGIYFYRIQVEDYADTRKMILLK